MNLTFSTDLDATKANGMVALALLTGATLVTAICFLVSLFYWNVFTAIFLLVTVLGLYLCRRVARDLVRIQAAGFLAGDLGEALSKAIEELAEERRKEQEDQEGNNENVH